MDEAVSERKRKKSCRRKLGFLKNVSCKDLFIDH